MRFGRKRKARAQSTSDSEKKVVDLNDTTHLDQLHRYIEKVYSIDNTLKNAIEVLKDYDERQDLSIDQIRHIYKTLKIDERMSPEEMESNLQNTDPRIVILEKQFLNASMDKSEFSCLISSILEHFQNVVAGNILDAITKIIQNFSYICLAAKNNFLFKDICFKFFTRNPNNDEILVLILNIHYRQASLDYKILNLFSCKKEYIHFNFLGALVKTEFIPDERLQDLDVV